MTGGGPSGLADALQALATLEESYAAISGRLKQVDTPESKAAVKRDIIAFFREVDDLHARVGELRERIRKLVEEYRGLSAPLAAARRRAQVYSDELNSSSFVERGWNFIAAEKYPEAVAALEKALALWPENLEAEGLLGWALMKSEHYDQALKRLQRVLVADPGNEMARVNLGFVCLKKGIYGEALEHLTRAAELGRDKKASIYAFHYLGLLHAERNEVEEATSSFKRAIEAGPNLIEAYYHLGALLYKHQKADQARAVWENAVARNPYNPYAKKSKALLKELDAGRLLEIS
jgi:tetratricopeptide (TPR) repeat protein